METPFAEIEQKLAQLSTRTREADASLWEYTRDLEWRYAVKLADARYKMKYIDALSENYRRGCEWWVEIGDSIAEYFRANPHIEVWVRTMYFQKR